ncbi:MAG: Crp/Fnr family transcriptional regulator [Bacteroidota bacterium]
MARVQTNCLDCKEKSSCFAQLDTNELTLADESKVQVSYKKGETIAKQNSFVTHLLYVKRGIVKVYRENADDTNIIYRILPKGSLIGLSSLFYSETFQYSIAALSDSQICSIDKKVVENLFIDNGNFSKTAIEELNKEIHHLRTKMVSLTHKQMEGRLADSLLFLRDHVHQSNSFKLSLSRKELAEFSGMSTMSVVRTIQSFIKKGIIKESSGNMEIMDKQGLEKLSE